MHPQLEAIAQELESASRRVELLAGSASEEQLRRRPVQGGWSASECVAHLNLATRAVLPTLDDALAHAQPAPGIPARMRLGLIGWLVWRGVRPDARMKARTSAPFVPGGDQAAEEVIAGFRELQASLLERLRTADGKPIHRIRIVSPFSDRVRYSVFAAFSILAAHEHRHLNQAERALAVTAA